MHPIQSNAIFGTALNNQGLIFSWLFCHIPHDAYDCSTQLPNIEKADLPAGCCTFLSYCALLISGSYQFHGVLHCRS
jgi:hypothetical protein